MRYVMSKASVEFLAGLSDSQRSTQIQEWIANGVVGEVPFVDKDCAMIRLYGAALRLSMVAEAKCSDRIMATAIASVEHAIQGYRDATVEEGK